MSDDIETQFTGAIETGKVHGAVLFATNKEHTFQYNEALGQRTLLSGEKRKQSLDDVLFLASATKIFATIAALQCVEDGLITLTGDLSAIVPELTSKEVITGFSEDGETPLLEPAKKPITLEMLLTHSSGTSYHFFNPHVNRWRDKFAPLGPNERRPVEKAFSYPLGYQPGEGWMYGPSLDWAGLIVERVTGSKLGEFMQKRIFDPLGINDGQFYPVTRQDLRDRMVDLNPQDPDGMGHAPVGGHAENNLRSKGDFGGHGLFLSGTSFMKLMHSILCNDGKLLKPTTVDIMFEDHLAPEAIPGFDAAMNGPSGPFFRVGVDPETKKSYGLGGLITLEDVDGWYGDRTLTWGGGLTLAWFIDRKNDLCGMCSVQASIPVDRDLVGSLKQAFRKDIYHKYNAWKDKSRQ